MTELVLCLTLISVGLFSKDSQVYNNNMKKISEISGLPVYCQAYSGESYEDTSRCNQELINILLKHYNMGKYVNNSKSKKTKEDRSLWIKPIKDLLESEGWNMVSHRIAEYRRESVAKLMTMDCESKVYRTEIRCYDHSLGIPEEILAEALESKRLQAEEQYNRGDNDAEDRG